MIEGIAVLEYFEKHPEAKAAIEEVKFDESRNLTVDDIQFIAPGWHNEPWFDKPPKLYAWFYIHGCPHYTKISD